MMNKKLVYSLIFLAFFAVLATNRSQASIIFNPSYPVYVNQEKVIIYYDEKTKTQTMYISPNFRGNAKDFVWIIPTPNKPTVDQAKSELFTAIDEATRPQYTTNYYGDSPLLPLSGVNMAQPVRESVSVIDNQTLEAFDVTTIETAEKDGLVDWLNKNEYEISKSMEYVLNDYIKNGYYFVIAKVNPDLPTSYIEGQLKEGYANPLKVTFESEGPIYPVKLLGASAYTESSKPAAYSFESGMQGWYQSYVAESVSIDQRDSTGMMKPTPYVGFKGIVATSSEAAKFGNFSLKMKASQGNADVEASTYLSKLNANTKYTFSAYVKTKNATAGTAEIKWVVNGAPLSSKPIDLSGAVSDWKRIEFTFTPTTNYADLRLSINKAGADAEVYWDGVQIEEGDKAGEFISEKLPASAVNNYQYGLTFVIYTIADHKKQIPGFNVEYAGFIDKKKLENFSTTDKGGPWIQFSGKKYVTRLTKYYTSYASLNNDLVVKDAENNAPVGNGQLYIENPVRLTLVIVLPIILEVGIIYYLVKRRRK